MYIEVIVNIDARVLPTEQAQAQRLREVAAYLTQEFPAHGKQRVVDIVDDATIFIHQYGFVDNEQIHWLNMSDEVYDWSMHKGGVLTLPAEHPIVTPLPCYYTYQDEARTVRLDNDTQGMGTWLSINNRDTQISSQAELLAHLSQATIPCIKWTRTIWLCEYCDQPGATTGRAFCPYCEDIDDTQRAKHYTDTELGLGLLLGLAILHLLIDMWKQRK